MPTVTKPQAPRTMMVPVMTMEEVPVLSEAERAELIASLKAAEAEIAAGEYTVHDPETFVARMMSVRAEALSKKAV